MLWVAVARHNLKWVITVELIILLLFLLLLSLLLLLLLFIYFAHYIQSDDSICNVSDKTKVGE